MFNGFGILENEINKLQSDEITFVLKEAKVLGIYLLSLKIIVCVSNSAYPFTFMCFKFAYQLKAQTLAVRDFEEIQPIQLDQAPYEKDKHHI